MRTAMEEKDVLKPKFTCIQQVSDRRSRFLSVSCLGEFLALIMKVSVRNFPLRKGSARQIKSWTVKGRALLPLSFLANQHNGVDRKVEGSIFGAVFCVFFAIAIILALLGLSWVWFGILTCRST